LFRDRTDRRAVKRALDVDRPRLIAANDARIDLLFTMSDNALLRDHYIGAKKRIHMHGRNAGGPPSLSLRRGNLRACRLAEP
jgi:hypothetical protein